MSTTATADKLVEILFQKGKLSEKDRDRLYLLHRKSGKPYAHLLVDEHVLSEEDTLHALGESLDLPVLHLESYQVDRELMRLVPQKIAERYEIIPVSRVGTILTVAAAEPLDLIALDDLKELTGYEIRLVLSTLKAIQNALTGYCSPAAALDQVLEEAETGQIEVISVREEETPGLARAVNEAPIVRMVNVIAQEAVRQRASDIHLEPYQDHFRIRYRVDGVLKETLRQPLEIYAAVIARIKILSNLDITEKRLPQDGRFKMTFEDREVDFRVSTLPTFFGEKGVLRLLDKTNVRAGLEKLGFSTGPVTLLTEAIHRPYGMILVTGPTGSGKSTTLYSILNMLNTPERNLMSIEDPIEYQIEGITQTQVNPDIDLTFANGLRSLLRQSPDVILVGEIRDTETADIAVKAALTGHLVLSTLHTNSAAGAVTRLIDMKVEPFLIASSVIVVAGQRLLRQICPGCKEQAPVPPEVLKRIALSGTDLGQCGSFKGKGCKQCGETGYFGRLGAVEVLPVNSEIRQLILARSTSDKIERAARAQGMETLFENALNLFKAGKTTLEEVLRVTATE